MPSDDGNPDATLRMNAAAEGDQAAADRLLPLVYDQLRRAAELRLAGEPDMQARIESTARENLGAHREGRGYAFPHAVLLGTAEKPQA